ncbi:MAG: cyclic pyranopterin monophosphate synthase MoaC [Acidobacteria bacterium]|nr:cyclic pyranopterin monophosphate synthase MoaC [Acidobacteriota bacterium]
MKTRTKAGGLTHVDAKGHVRMVDVTAKAETVREATAVGEIRMSGAAVRAIRDGAVKKGDPLQTARLAGIMAAKRTSDLIPLCHPLAVTAVDVQLTPRRWGYAISATVRTTGPTGVEMEALTAVSVAALTVYDMLKAIDRTMEIGAIRVTAKSGGRSGTHLSGSRSPGGPGSIKRLVRG